MHIDKLWKMVEQLSSIGEKVLNIHFVMALFRSLLELYGSLVVSLGTRPPIELALTMDVAQLLNEESHDNRRSSNDYKKNAKFSFCSKKGDYKRECWTKEKNKKSKKLRKTFQKEQAYKIDRKDWKNNELVFVIALSVVISDIEEYIDFAAFYNMTWNQSWFLSFEILPQGPKVYLGNNIAFSIKEKDNISFQVPNNI